jgi:hypothetical protein
MRVRAAEAKLPAAAVEITPAMIEAGVGKLLLFEPADAEVAVCSVFKAMLLASRRFRNHQIFESELEAPPDR